MLDLYNKWETGSAREAKKQKIAAAKTANETKATDAANAKESIEMSDQNTEDQLPDSDVVTVLQKRMYLYFLGTAASLLAAFAALISNVPSAFGVFALLCAAICGYSGIKFIGPLKTNRFRVVETLCVEKESIGYRRQYCKYYFEPQDSSDTIVIESADKHKYRKKKYYKLVFSGVDTPMTSANMLVSIREPAPSESKKEKNSDDEED